MSITPSKYIKENRKKSTFNFKQSLTDRIGADTFNTDIEQFNKDYSADYLSNWHSAEDINTYYDRLSSLNDRTKAYQSYVNLYGTDEQKSVLGDIGKQISAYDEMIGKRQDVLDYYGTFKDAEAYSNALAYETEKAAKAKAEQDRIASLDVDAVMAEIANIDNQVAQYENNKKKVYAVPNANINEVEAYARDMNNRIEALKEQKTALESDISAREIMDRNKMYTDILGSSEFASFVPTDDGMYDPVEMVNEPFEKTNPNVQFQYDSNGMITTNAQFANYGSTRYEHMTADEYKLYQYLKEFYGQEVAGQYAYDLDNELISRQQTEFKGYAEKHPVLGTIASFATAPMQAVDFVAGGLGYALTGDLKQGEMTAITSALREGASPDSDFGKFLYNTTTSGLDSFLAAALGGKAGGVILGLSAASSTMNDVLARGGTAEQALTSGVASGLFEGFFESFSIGRLKSMKPEEIVKNFKVFAQNALKSVATNASEELATEVANIIFDSAYMGELSNVSMMLDQYRSQGLTEEEAKRKVAHNLGVQVLEAAASGALIGGGMTAIGGGVGLAKVDKARRKLGKSNISGGKTATLIKEATEYFKGEEYKKQQALIQKVEKGLADNKQGRSQQRNIGKLIEAYVEANYKEQNRELAEDSVNNIEKTKKTIENEATKTKVDNTNPTITNDNLPKILGFKEGKLSETVIETENGATAFTEESAANADIGTLYACAIRLGNTQSANNFVQNWDGITDPFQYYLDFLKFQMRGTYAPDSYDKTMTDYAGVKMSPAAKHAAFQSGISLRESTKEKITKQSEALKGEYEKLGGKAKKGKFNDSKLNYSALTKEQKDVVNFTRILSDYLGVNVEFFVSQKGKRGANGYYKAKNNTIYLDIYAGIGNKESYSAIKDCLINTMSHEVVHNMKVTAPTEYAALRDFIIDKLSKQEGYDLDAKIEQIIAENSDQGFTVEDAIEEIVAMSCEDLLGSSEKLQTTLTEFYAQNEKAANSFNKFVREVLNRLKAFFEKIIGKKSIAEESQLMAKQSAEFISELQKRYDAALLAMREGNAVRNTLGNLTATEQVTLAENGIAVDESTGDVHKVRNSVRYSTANKDAQGNIIDLVTVGKKSFNTEAIAKLVSTATGRSIEDARKWVRSEMAIANLVMDNPEFLDFEPDDRYQGIKKNSDYPQGTVDLSNLCPKREEFTTMFDLLQKKYSDKLFTAADVASMREILKNHGITVACGACFVEDRRQLLGEIADTYINMWKEAVENGTPLQKTNAEGKKIKLQITAALAKQYGLTKGADIMATDKYIPTQYDLTTYEGFKLLEKNHPLVAMGFNRYNNSRGQQAGRLIEGRAEYDRQILGWTPNKVKTVNNNGGLRIFSFSDFEVVHLLDLVQVIIDCAAMGVKIQGYTKIPAFARLVRNTGIKLNRSLIPKGETGIKIVNGKEVLDIDLVEGINIEDENFLDESDNDNVGNIIIGINPKQIGIAMLDDFIDYIIPFHTNKSKDICRKLGVGEWLNYKESQHEKDIDTGKASKHNVNIYTQVINKYHPTNKTEFVDAFLKECRSQKKVPRYSEFLYKEYKSDGAYSDEGGRFDYTYREGYHKLLVDFKMFDKAGNILPQGDIVPELDDAFMAELLDKEIARKKDYTFPQEVYDEIDRVFGDGDKVMRQLRKVNPVQPSSDKWQRTHTTEEVKAQFPNLWDVSADESEVRNPTQISGTVKSYRKIYDFLKKSGFNGTILDASSGLGYGTRAGIDEYGFDVEDIEPYPDKSYSPKYTDYSTLDKKYDVIISNAVLNVIPQDQRDALVVKMGELLNEGGRLFVNVRGDDVKNASSKEAINEDLMEYYISKSGSYQKGFTKPELVAYLEDALGDEYTVMPTTFFGKASAVVTKSGTSFAQKFIDKTLDSFGITRPKDFVHVQRQVLTTLLNEGFFTNVEERSRTDINEASGMVIETNKSGIDETFDINNFRRVGMTKKIAKLATIRMLPEIIKDGKLVTDNVNYQYGYSKNVRFAYITHDVEIDGKRITLRLDIKKSPQKNKFWVHHVELIENVSDSPASTDKGTEAGQAITDIKPIVSQSTDSVNPSDEKTFEQKRIETPGASEVLSDLFRDNPNLNGYAEQKQELKSYKELLRSVRVNEQRIAEIDAEIKSLKRKHAQSGKGTRMAELYEMRKRAEDRVKEKQNRMFKMEATSLKEVIQKETARLLTERSKEERDLSKKQQKEIRENYARREYIKKIEDRAKGLTNAVKNVGDKHVPAPLREAIADLVMSLDFSSKSKLAGKGDTKKDIQFADAFRQLANLVGNKLPNTTDKETAPLDEFFIDCDITDEFRNQFEEIKNEIDNIVYRRGGSGEDTYVLRNLSSEQLRQINSALYKLGKQISKANQLMENNLYKNVIEMSEDFLTFADKFVLKQDVKRLEKLIDVDNLIPYYAFKRMGKVGMSLFNEWADGMDKYAKVAKEVVDFTNSLYTAKEIKEWNNTVHEIEIKGKKLYFTTAHLMSFYCLWKREAAKSHISGYGIRVETFDVDKTAKKPLGKTYTNPANGVHITDETAQILLDELNKDKRAKVVADALQKYMSTRCAELANEITMKRFGEKAYTEEFYFPMEVNENEKPTDGDINAESLYALVNKSFTKQLTPNSTSSLTIRNIFDVFASHTTDVAAYHSLAIPLLDTLKFYNYKQKGYDAKGDSEAKTVRGKIVEAFGEPFLNYLKNFIKDTTGTSITSDRGAEGISKWVSRYKIAAVAANLRVIVLQPTSYLRVSAVMKHRYLAKEIKDIPQLNKAVERMNKYSGVALWKNELGFRDVNISKSLADKIKHADTIGDKVTEVAMKGAEFADKITWANIWLACEEEIKATETNIPVGSDAFYDKVSKRFRDVIYSTQVVDSPLAKSNMARSKTWWNKSITSFMSEPVVSHNLLLDAYHELADAKRRGEKITWNNGRKVGRLVLAYSINAIAQAVVSSLVDAARKIADDEDEEFADAYWSEFISNLLQELNPLSKIPIINGIMDAINATFFDGYYSGQSMEASLVERAVNAVKEAIKFSTGKSSTSKTLKKIMDAISSLTGIPLSNTYREIKTVWNNVMKWFNS